MLLLPFQCCVTYHEQNISFENNSKAFNLWFEEMLVDVIGTQLWWSGVASIIVSGFKADWCKQCGNRTLKIGSRKSGKQTNLQAVQRESTNAFTVCSNTRRHRILLFAYRIESNWSGEQKQCDFVGVQNGFWLQAACGRGVDPLIQRRGGAVHPLSSSGPLQSNESLNQWTFTLCTASFLTTWSRAGTKVYKMRS